MDKRLALGGFGLLGLLVVILGALALYLGYSFYTANGRAASLQDELKQNASELVDAETELASLQSQLGEVQDERDAVSEQLEQSKRDSDAARAENFEISRALDKLICRQKIASMNYSGILEATSRLEAYTNSLSYVAYVNGSYRDSLWNNTDTKVHAIRYTHSDGNPYSVQYLVYFDEFGWKPSTFFIDEQCWIDPPVNIPD